MYLTNKYTKWYNNIISAAQIRKIDEYTEKHHIIPKCLGGSNSKENLVKLTGREHFICHLLLVKMVEGKNNKAKMAYASMQQSRSSKYKDVKISSRIYALIRKELADSYKGIPHSEQHIANWKESFKGKKFPGRNSGEKNPMFGKKHLPESNEKRRDAQKGIAKPKFICQHCGAIIGGKSNYLRYHSSNCKSLNTLP